jgi:methylenetetrahydrofolate dehydrogenase (NADP+)/methenyltetrahydrofolate cyclohydrolase
MKLLNGKEVSGKIKEEIAAEVEKMKMRGEKVPHLAAVLVGNDGASLTYVGSKVRTCKKIGFESTLIHLPEDTTEEALLDEVYKLNGNSDIDGYIVQLPLPGHIDEEKVLLAVHPDKDVDGFHPTNFGKMALDMPSFIPATPFGIMELLKRNGVETQGKHCVVIGRSHIVGRPISILMSQKGEAANATVTIAHSRTRDLKSLTLQADIIISALGIPGFLKADMVKDGVVVVDVGITRVADPSKERG